MNPLVVAYLKRERERLQRAELVRLQRELRETQDKLEPMRLEAKRRRKERMRQDGPNGFVMKPKEQKS